MRQRQGPPPWVFFEGPPTANGRPGLHHAWARVYKDLFCRYRTMRGFQVARRAGWDTHGLPVEVEVEKRLGISGKRQIEDEVGIAEFTRLCRESVLDYVADWQRLTERIGYWVDLDAAYWTFDPAYVQSVWWHLKQLFDQGLLYEDLKVLPYCPRCGTALSSHELGQPGVYPTRRTSRPTSACRWSTRRRAVAGPPPWWCGPPPRGPCSSNTGVAVHPDLTYAVVDGWWWPRPWSAAVFGEGAAVDAPGCAAADLVGLPYRRPLDVVAAGPGAERGWRVVPADFVTTEEGTGLVHLAPAFGEIDRQVGRAHGLPVLNPVGPDGRFTEAAGWLAGQAGARNQHRDQRPAGGRRACWCAASPTSTPTRTAGGAAPPSSTGASPAGTWPPPPARTTCWRPTGTVGLAPRLHPRRAVRRVAGEQRRLGALP